MATQILSAPKFEFMDPDADRIHSAFYRVRWVK